MFTLPFDLNLDYPFAVAAYPAGATFGPRHLRNWEFVWLIEGDAEYRHDALNVAAPEGSIVLCRPGVTDFFRWDTRRRTRHAYFHFDVNGKFPDEWPAPEQWPLVRPPAREHDLLPALFTSLLAQQTGRDNLQAKLLAFNLLHAFVTGSSDAGVTGITDRALPDAVARVLTYVAQRLDEEPGAKITLSELAEAACVTPEYLCRLFSSATGHAPIETVRLARLDRAASLLSRTNYNVSEIAALCGFDSPFHFSRAFKAAYNSSPRTFRKEIEEGRHIPATRLLRTIIRSFRE